MSAAELHWLISVILVPIVGGLAWLVWHNRELCISADDELRRERDVALDVLRKALSEGDDRTLRLMEEHRKATDMQQLLLQQDISAARLKAAETYVTMAHLQTFEARIFGLLERLEAKFDRITETRMKD